MNKALIATLLVLIIAMTAVGPAVAQKSKLNVKGEVIEVGSSTLTIKTSKGATYVVTVPEGIGMNTINVGDSVLVKAILADDGSWVVVSVKKVGPGGKDNEDDREKPEGFLDNSAFCGEGKQEIPHPLAPKLAVRYGVTEEWVMEKFCEGYSIGAIMLAIKTSQIEGITATPNQLLERRAAGNAWGQIWKELKLIGSEKEGHSPPGLLKKPDHAGPKDKD